MVTSHVTTKVSQELMQTMLSASFGCISYLRGIFPDDTFTEERYNPSNAKGPRTTSRGNGQRLMRLRRNVAPEATKLLDYLEQGVFDALNHKYLASVILSISLDKLDENNVHEAYTFQFSYEHGQPPSLTIKDQLRKTATSGLPLDSAKRSMQQLFRQLITLTQSLSPLPDDLDKIISIRLFYNDNTPDDYEPPGFRAALASESARFVTRGADEIPHDQQVGTIATGHHACILKVTTLDEVMDRSREAFGTLKLWDAEHNAKTACQTGALQIGGFESSFDVATQLEQQCQIHDTSSCSDTPSRASISTQTETTQLLESRLVDSHPQMDQRETNNACKVEQFVSTRSQKNTVKATLKSCKSGTGLDRVRGNVEHGKGLQNCDQTPETRRLRERSDAWKKTDRDQSHSNDDRVSCECGDLVDEGIMVQCDMCQGWSHVPCYGYMDSVLDEGYVHKCFSCTSIAPEELENFRSLATMRRALHSIWQDGFDFTSTRAFGQSIGIKDIQTANGILQRLEKEGWIRQSKTLSLSTRRTSKASKTKPTHEVIRTPENSARLLTSYFDPRKNLNLFHGMMADVNTDEPPKTGHRTRDNKDSILVKNSLTDLKHAINATANACNSPTNEKATKCSNLSSSDANLVSTGKVSAKRKRFNVAQSADRIVTRVQATPDTAIVADGGDGDDDTTDEMDVDLSVCNSVTKRAAASVPARRSSARIKRMKVSICSKSIVAPGLDDMEA